MIYIKDLKDINIQGPSVVILGKFDGLHRGHMKIFKRALETAATYDCDLAVFTFSISPQAVMGQRPNTVLMTSKERKRLMEAAGADILVECPFTDELKNMEAEEFVSEILLKRLKAKAVITGRDFRFGKGRRGDTALLAACAARYGFYAESVEKERDGEREISSTYIREEIEKGNMEKASALLGYDFFVSGKVTKGRKLGRTIGFPTANIIPEPEKLMPPYGVYSSFTKTGDKVYRSITDIGTKPTVDGEALGIETYICDFKGDIYGEDISVGLLHLMRREQKFDSVEILKKQLESDVKERMSYEK